MTNTGRPTVIAYWQRKSNPLPFRGLYHESIFELVGAAPFLERSGICSARKGAYGGHLVQA